MIRDRDYFEEQEYRGYVAGRLIVLLWIFMSGAAAGYVLRGVVG